MPQELYPFKFTPILKEKIWGGDKLMTVLNKESTLSNIGESWEISDVEENTSIVSNGELKGKSLKLLLANYKEKLVGKKNYDQFGNQFPLLIKFIDAKQDLSIQLHPNDELAKKRHNSFGKTEMWYVMQADEGANLIVDFNQKMNAELYLEHLKESTLPKILNFEKVKQGDTYFIEVGRVHAIGAGVMLAEIQQTSDITYRIYDWDRKDEQGNYRELHTDLALEAIGFDMPDNYRVTYETTPNISNEMVNCPYFTTNYLTITEPLEKHNKYDSFVIYMCMSGEAKIETKRNCEVLAQGESILIPAELRDYKIISDEATLLEVYV